ncbi:hypothetical protein FQR65_LT18906 [Abscondita terminalis]|nr:hypothetical protein FQR65_LT18906 [Abscondita terminalis]
MESIVLYDVENDQTYDILVSTEDAKHMSFASALLRAARNDIGNANPDPAPSENTEPSIPQPSNPMEGSCEHEDEDDSGSIIINVFYVFKLSAY